MRTPFPEKLEAGRARSGYYGSPPGCTAGAFTVQGPCGEALHIIASDGRDVPEAEGWEHVSVSTRRRTPNWQEMCFVKALFWSEEDCVMQLHPPQSVYVNNHPHCLHLWYKPGLPAPPVRLVGNKALGDLSEFFK